MKRVLLITLTTLCSLGSRAVGAPACLVPTGEYLPTQVPYTYILDRGDVYAPEYAGRTKAGPPLLLEGGNLTAGHPYFGPMCDLAAFRAGRPEPADEESVGRYRERRAATQACAKRLQAAGAQRVIAYVCMMTTGGDPAKRTGFWRFYDRWSAFSEFRIPPRPTDDPEQWQQRQPDGAEHHFYTRDHPPYKPMFRFSNCVNHPGWRAYMQWLIEEGALPSTWYGPTRG